jgi:Flp pilus assembly protein TadD
MGEQFTALAMLYARPIAAASRILDRGRLFFALIAAALVCVLLHVPELGSYSQSLRPAHLRPAPPEAAPDESNEQPHGAQQAAPPGFAELAVRRWIGAWPMSVFSPLGALVIVVAPVVILLRAAGGFGSFPVLLRSEYGLVLLCTAMSWTAAFLPLGIVIAATGGRGIWLNPPFYLACSAYFLVLLAICLRTAFGTGFGSAAGMSAATWIAAAVGIGLSGSVGGALNFLMSPFLLYCAYVMFAGDVRSLGEGLRSRQNLRRQLEISTNNPHDADAHYQLGLIYFQRRQFTEALARFRKSVEIDPREAESQLALGRVLRETGKPEEAIAALEKSAKLDDKVALSEVWRELGAAYFQAGRLPEAESALSKYTDRRPYDPEGLYWFGRTLAGVGKADEARRAFVQCIEAVDTMPSHRRAHVRRWAGEARSQMKALK